MTEKRLKLAHLALSMNAGGLERIILNLACCPTMHDIEFVVICLDEKGELAAQAEDSGAKVLLCKRKKGLDLGLILRLAMLLRRERISALHTHSLDPMFYGGIAAKLAGVRRRFHTQHNVQLSEANWKQRLKFKIAAHLFTRVISVSEGTAQMVASMGVPRHRCLTILNGVEERCFARPASPPKATPSQRDTAEWVVGTVARLSREKGVHRLIEAFAGLQQQHGNSRLYIIGDGPERRSLEQLAQDLNVTPKVSFCGYQKHVEKFLPLFDVFVLPSLTEGIPLALLEAMAAGRPVVATAVGGVPEVVLDNHCGVLVAADDATALQAAIIRLMADQQGRLEMGARAERRIRENFSQTAMARAYRRMYLADEPKGIIARCAGAALRVLPRKSILWRGSPESREVALTFDDGPESAFTPEILDILGRYGVKATFFLIGQKVEKEPNLVREILRHGHELANHSYTHSRVERLPIRGAIDEVQRAQRTIESLQGRRCQLFRPPRGRLCTGTFMGAWLNHMTIVMWSKDLKDFLAQHPDEITSKLSEARISPGDIVLYHGTNAASVAALPTVLEYIKSRGWAGVPVSQLQEGRG